MKRRTHKRRKRSKKREKEKQTHRHIHTHTHKNKKTYNPKKEERQQEEKKKKRKKKEWWRRMRSRGTKQKNKHNQQKHSKIDQNHDENLKYLLHKKSSIIKMIAKGPLVKKGNSKKYQTIVLVFLKMNGKGRRMQRQIYRDRFVALTKIAH